MPVVTRCPFCHRYSRNLALAPGLPARMRLLAAIRPIVLAAEWLQVCDRIRVVAAQGIRMAEDGRLRAHARIEQLRADRLQRTSTNDPRYRAGWRRRLSAETPIERSS